MQHGAKVLLSAMRGKGISMKEGMEAAKNDILVYVDADIPNYETDVIKKLSDPIINGSCDFVKATFSREAGRVTELVAKPLLSLLFPDLIKFSQPLSGMIAIRKKYLKKVIFENDYGVDIGILIDVYDQGARIREVNIGFIENKSKPWQALGAMSKEVSRAILKRAAYRKLLGTEDLEMISIVEDEMEAAVEDALSERNKIIVFDLSSLIGGESFVLKAAERLKLKPAIMDILNKGEDPYIEAKLIAGHFKGVRVRELQIIIEKLNIISDAAQTVRALHDKGYIVGIVTDTYNVVSNYVKDVIGADFALSNELEIRAGKLTGEVRIPYCFIRNSKSLCGHSVCKSNALRYLSDKYNIKLSDIIAVASAENSLCMLKLAGKGIALGTNDSKLIDAADSVIKNKFFKEVLKTLS